MQKVYLYNTLSRKKEELIPINGQKINFFVCGPTVYDYPHLGHAKAYIQFDFIVKFLRQIGYEVFYLQNVTNIDDKIIRRAEEKNVAWEKLSSDFEKIFHEDMKSLGVNAVSQYARATDYIPQIVEQVKTLLDKGYAYQINDGIYFEVAKFKDYGKLSGRRELKEDDGISRIDENPDKRGWNDFCLWKLSKEGEPFWETELGKGRPGWHIEDTAITETFFGPQYDIHGGGADLIFPHHEAEISQMEAASGKVPLVRYWMHIGFLNVDSRKMGKSKGNFRTIREVLANFDYRTIRYLFLSVNYRSPVDFSVESLEQSRNALRRINELVDKINWEVVNEDEKKMVEATKLAMWEKISDDFDTPNALSVFFDFIRMQNTKGRPGKYVGEFLRQVDAIFGFINFEEELIPDEVGELVKRREEARLSKNFAESDRIREEIKSRGYVIEDTADGCKIKKVMLH